MQKEVIAGNIRVQLLSEDIVRIEYGKDGVFCDENTFFIPNRTDYAETLVAYTEENGVLCFGEYELYIPENAKSLAGVKLEKNGKRVYIYKKQKNSGELPPLDKTPEVFAVSDTPRILIPEGGYSAERKGVYRVEENVQDIYLLLCGKDFRKLRRLYVELTGRNELVRLSTFGGWNSKYYAYTEEEAKQLILDYENHNVPLDKMVIDTDWRAASDRGIGYDVNTKLFPDMKGFMDFAHAHGVEVMFNDHPEPVEGAESVFSSEEISYREEKLQSLMALGLDTWWYDRNWSTKLKSPSEGVNPETLGLYLFEDVTRHYYQKQAGNGEIYRRPVIMGNVDNIANGFYLGIASSASHRYSIQWTGDIASSEESLATEVETLIKAGNNCIPYVNADCGGHQGNPDKELFVRWIQFGTLSPVFRPHCTNTVTRTREPWVYDEEVLDIVREYNNLRYRLLPVIYKNAYNNYRTGEPIFKSLAYEYPNDRRAQKCKNEYMLGNDILVAPGTAIQPVEKRNYTTPVKAVYYNGTELEGDPIAKAEYRMLAMNLNNTPPEQGVPVYNFSARFETKVRFDKDIALFLISDDGATVYIDGKKVHEDKTMHSAMNFPLGEIEGEKEHEIVIEYFQAGDKASCMLYYGLPHKSDERNIYLPAGRWMDLFDGKVYAGGRTIRKAYGLREMPLFVRMGALIPLAYEAKNTKEQKWNRLVFDFYADKDSSDAGYLYEDDGETTAYKFGQYRKSKYEAVFDAGENAYVIKLHASEGSFGGDKCFGRREITVKFHCLKGAGTVQSVKLNGEAGTFTRFRRKASVFPLNTDVSAADSDIVAVTLSVDVTKENTVKFYL